MEKVKLKDITINLNNRRKPLNSKERQEISKEGLYPYCGANNIMDYVDEYLFNEEIICIAEDGGKWGKNEICSYIMNTKCWVNNHAHVIKVTNKINIEYLKYWLNYTDLNSVITGAVVKKLTQKALNNLEIYLPEITKQKEIVQKLNRVQKFIDKNQKQIKLLEELVKSQFDEMFGDVKNNKYNWEISELQKYFDVKGGKRIPKGMKYSDIPTKHVYLRTTDMKNATILDNDIKYIEEEVFEKIKKYTVEAGDIYLTNVGENLGMAGIIPDKYSGANLTENAVKLIKKTEKINGKYLAYYINSEETQYYINQRKMSVGVPKLAIFRIQTIPLMLPPIELQNNFIKKLEKIDQQKAKYQKNLETAQELMNKLMDEYFNKRRKYE